MGGVVRTWTTFLEVWASVEPIVGREYMAAQQTQSSVTHKVRMRYQPGVTAGMRVAHDGEYLKIIDIKNIDSRKRELVLMCTPVGADAVQ